MTSKEALNKLYFDNKDLHIEIALNDRKICEIYNIIKQDLDRLEILEQKETPMKPIRYNTNQYKCPKCLNQIKGKKWIYNMETKRFDIKSKIKVEKVYCPYCGQKLDWSEDDDK